MIVRLAGPPACGWRSRWVCDMLGEIPRWLRPQRDWLLPLRELQSCLSTLPDSFLFRERLHSSQLTIQRHAASFKEGTTRPLKAFQRMLGLMVAASPAHHLGLLHVRPIQFWLKQRVPSVAWHHGRHGPCMCGHSTGDFRPPRVCPKHYGRKLEPRPSEMGHFLDLVKRPALRPGHLRCVSGSFISAGDAG